MRLKKLQLFGFKSFADRTEIIFDEGVTCVVGPNGCGKSNISDSIRWVLGERSAKLLRGSKMEDVIFNGTDFRKPLGLAEVSLTIDNTDRGLPIEYNEVTLTRRLYRSGESEYLINKTLCRLKDIQDIILDTGIGSNSYSMIEQGRIDYILNADAEERRFLIEEAAGISKYKVKKEEAIRKLERTEENRLRLNDIIHEVHKNIQYAERQARRAERYKEEFEKLKKLETRKALTDTGIIQTEKTALQSELDSLQNQLHQVDAQMSGARRQQESFNESAREILERYRAAESQCYALQSKIEHHQQQLKFNQEKRVEIANRQGQITQEEQELCERLARGTEEIAQKTREVESIGSNRAEALAKLKQAEFDLQTLEQKLREIKSQIEESKGQAFHAATETSRLRNDFHRLLAFLEPSQHQQQKQDAGAQRLQGEANAWRTKKISHETQLQNLSTKIGALATQKAASDDQIRMDQEHLKILKTEEDHAGRFLHEQQTRLGMLQEMEQNAKADEDALLEPSKNFQRDFVKTLREIFTVEPGFEWALEAALETFSKSLVAEDLPTAEILLDRIREKNSVSTGILILKNSREIPQQESASRVVHPRVVRALADVVQIRAGYENLFRPFIHQTYILEDLSTSELLREFFSLSMNHKFLTPGGIALGPEGKIFYRNHHLSSEQNRFKRQAEIDAILHEIEKQNRILSEKENQIRDLECVLQNASKELDQVEADFMEAKVQKESLESTRAGMEERIHSFQRELDLIGFESRELQAQQQEAPSRKSELEKALALAEEHERNLINLQEKLTQDFNRGDVEKNLALHTFAERRALDANIEERSKLLAESLQMMPNHIERNAQRISDLSHEADLLDQRQQQLAVDDSQLEKEQLGLQESRRETDIAVELVRQEKDRSDAALENLQNEMQISNKHQQDLHLSRHQFEMKIMDLGYKEKTIAERILQTYRLDLSAISLDDFPAEEKSAEELAEQIEALKTKVEALGTVNLLAIEEYEELKQRYEFLMTQQKDLDDAREQLMETIRKINRTTKGLFEETFHHVQKTFQEYYQTLFRGGHAQLVLVDETNPLESGIDIIVRPPGKKSQHISLLSGGEKALTAIALLFALFKIKPSPFCVLDEVDAPLDEANVDRFVAVLKTFVATSQFIIVTHNRKTIGMGDSLYGVTMQEAGISKLVSVKVSLDQESAAPAEPLAENA